MIYLTALLELIVENLMIINWEVALIKNFG